MVAGSNPVIPTVVKPSFLGIYEGFSFKDIQQSSVKVAVQLSIYNTFGLVSKDTFDTMHKFKKSRLVKSSSSRGYYILYYVWDVQKNDLVRKRLYIPKKYKTEAEKLAYAKDTKKQIDTLLKEGYHIDRTKVVNNNRKQEESNPISNKVFSIRDAADVFIKIKETKKLYKRGIGFYKNTLNRFISWLAERGQSNLWIGELDHQIIQPYFLYLLIDRKNEAKTYNNTLGVLKTFYNECLKQEWVEGKNPFDKIERQPEDYGTMNKPFSNNQIKEIKAYMLENDPYLWKIICFIYYSFMRPSEIRRLQVKDIDLEKDLIWISGKTSKTKKNDVIPIVPALRKQIVMMDLQAYHPEDFLFSASQTPSSIKMGENYIGKHFKKVKNHFKLDEDYTIYGFKHTAVVNWYKQEKDIRKIQKMCRHSSMLMTERYLKSLGLLEDKESVSLLPEI